MTALSDGVDENEPSWVLFLGDDYFIVVVIVGLDAPVVLVGILWGVVVELGIQAGVVSGVATAWDCPFSLG